MKGYGSGSGSRTGMPVSGTQPVGCWTSASTGQTASSSSSGAWPGSEAATASSSPVRSHWPLSRQPSAQAGSQVRR